MTLVPLMVIYISVIVTFVFNIKWVYFKFYTINDSCCECDKVAALTIFMMAFHCDTVIRANIVRLWEDN